MEDKKVLLSIKDLQVKFRVRGRILTAIRGVTLDIYENESIAIVGESGAGKSVFTKAFAGMLDSNGFIDQGDIIFNDAELSDTVVPLNSYAKKTMPDGTVKTGVIESTIGRFIFNEIIPQDLGFVDRSIPENEGAGAGKRRKNDAERGRA